MLKYIKLISQRLILKPHLPNPPRPKATQPILELVHCGVNHIHTSHGSGVIYVK